MGERWATCPHTLASQLEQSRHCDDVVTVGARGARKRRHRTMSRVSRLATSKRYRGEPYRAEFKHGACQPAG